MPIWLFVCAIQISSSATDGDLGDVFSILEEERRVVVSVATRDERTVEESPAIITVFTQDQLRQFGYSTIAEVLSNTLGFYVTDDFIVPNVAVRGVSGGLFAESSIIKVTIDGKATSYRPTSGNWLGPELVPFSSIERIEIIRGPASALYGADAFMGVVNIVTASASKLNGIDLRATPLLTNTHLGFDVDGTVGAKRGPFSLVIGARVNRRDLSGLALPDTSPSPSLAPVNQGSLTTQGFVQTSNVAHAKLSYDLNKLGSVTLSGRISLIDRSAEFAPWTQLSYGLDARGAQSQTLISLYNASTALDADLHFGEKVKLRLQSQFFMSGTLPTDRIETTNSSYYVHRNMSSIGSDSTAEIQWSIIPRLQLVAGAQVVFDQEQLLSGQHILKFDLGDKQAGDVAFVLSNPNGRRKDFFNPAAYLQLVATPIDRYLTLVAGGRFDNHNIYGPQMSARFGAVSRVLNNLHLKLLYGSAFKQPSALLLYATPLQVGDISGNPKLKPQYVHTVEGEVQYNPTPWLSLTSSVSYNIMLNIAEFLTQGFSQVANNLSSVYSLSWESRIDASYGEWLRGFVSAEYNYTTRHNAGDDSYLSNLFQQRNFVYPPLQVRLGLSGRVPVIPLRASVLARFVSERPPSQSNVLASGRFYTLPAYVQLDASLSTIGLSLFDRGETTFSLIGKNLLGVVGPDPGFSGIDYPLSPRTLMLMVGQTL